MAIGVGCCVGGIYSRIHGAACEVVVLVEKFKKAIKRECSRKDVGDTTKLCYMRIHDDLDNPKWRVDFTDAIDRIQFIEDNLTHIGLELGGQPLKLAFFQKFLLMSAYGFYNKDGSWRFKRIFLTCGRQNGKSVFVGAWGICHFVFDLEKFHNQILGIFYSNNYDQAHALYSKASRMLQDSGLDRELSLKVGAKGITDESKRNFLQPITSNHRTADGKRCTAIFGDEVATARNSKLALVLRSGIEQNANAMEVLITTASTDLDKSLGYKLHDGYKNALEHKEVADHCLPLLFEPDPNDKMDDPLTWAKSNPLLADGVFSIKGYEQAYQDSNKSWDEQISFKTKILNQYVANSDSYLDDKEIQDAMLPEPLGFRMDKDVYIGIDDTLRKDLGCITMIQERDGIWYVDSKFFATNKRIDYHTKIIRSSTWYDALSDGHVIPMGQEQKDSDMLMSYLKEHYLTKYDRRIRKIEYDAVSYSAKLMNDMRRKYGEVFGVDTYPAKTKLAVNMCKSLFIRREIKINPNPLMAHSLGVMKSKMTNAGYEMLVRDEVNRADDGGKSLVYAMSGVIAVDPDFYLDKFGAR